MEFYIDKETEAELKSEIEKTIGNKTSSELTDLDYQILRNLDFVLSKSKVLPTYNTLEEARYYSKFRQMEQSSGFIVKK